MFVVGRRWLQPRILLTGTSGQLGTEVAEALRARYGNENVICSSLNIPEPVENIPNKFDSKFLQAGPFEYLDVRNIHDFNRVVVNNKITWLVHFAAVLSAVGERKPSVAIDVNMRGLENALDVAHRYKLRVLVPSSIAAFGPNTPRTSTPDLTIQDPTSIYGISKVYTELLGNWYHKKKKVDFRCLRYPGIISWKSKPGGGTTDWACDMYFKAVEDERYECFVGEDTKMPLMYMEDLIKCTDTLLSADSGKLTQRTYNVTGLSTTPREMAASIRKFYPNFELVCKPDFRQGLADSWPMSIDDSNASRDWDWAPDYLLDQITESMITNIRSKVQN